MMGAVQSLTGWRGYAAVALVGGLVIGGVQQLRVNATEARQEAAKQRAGIAEAANVQCAADVGEARLAMARIQHEAQERADRAQAAVAAAEGQAAKHEGQASYWRRRAATTPDQCVAAADALDEYLRGTK